MPPNISYFMKNDISKTKQLDILTKNKPVIWPHVYKTDVFWHEIYLSSVNSFFGQTSEELAFEDWEILEGVLSAELRPLIPRDRSSMVESIWNIKQHTGNFLLLDFTCAGKGMGNLNHYFRPLNVPVSGFSSFSVFWQECCCRSLNHWEHHKDHQRKKPPTCSNGEKSD